MRRRILLIPHSSDSSSRRRLVEVGRVLCRRHDVFVLHWHEPSRHSLAARARASLRDALARRRSQPWEGMTRVTLPVWHRPLSLMASLNAASLLKFMRAASIDTVINGPHHFFATPPKNVYRYTHVFDVSDVPSIETRSAVGRCIEAFMRSETAKADAVTACSLGLADLVMNTYGRTAVYVPNGVRLHEFNDENLRKGQALRRSLGLEKAYVLAYIGRMGEWMDFKFLVNFHAALKRSLPNAALLLVGAGPAQRALKKRGAAEGIVCTGEVPENAVTPYFYCADCGVVPSKKNFFQDMAFHIKLLEFAAAGKPVIATPLTEIERMCFSHVVTAPCTVPAWMQAFWRAYAIARRGIAAGSVALYDWCLIAEQFEEVIASCATR